MKKNDSKNEIHRRKFIKSVIAAGSLTILPRNLIFGGTQSSGILKSVSANDKVNLACCGIGHRGKDIIKKLYNTGLANIVALCDVDMGASHTTEILQKFPDVPRFQDFRQMFDKMGSQFDAVTVGTPDFSHFPIAMLAMSSGKHVYVEKPLAHTFREIELLMKAEKKYRVNCQMGNQGHSGENYFQFKTWTEAGIIKNVTRITAHMNGKRRWHGLNVSDYLEKQIIPDTLDWDGWLATSKFHEYNKGYINGDWRSWYDFGNGALGDWGAHLFDTAHEFLQLGLPTEVNPLFIEGHNNFIFPQASTLLFRFPARKNMPPVDLTWYDGVNNLPPLPEGYGGSVEADDVPPPTAGTIETAHISPGRIIYGEGLTFKGGSHGSALKIIPESTARDMENSLPEVPLSPSDHYANFLLACQGKEKCRSPFTVAGPLCQVMMLGVIAQRLNTKLIFDPAHKRFVGNTEANVLLKSPSPRKEWKEFYRM